MRFIIYQIVRTLIQSRQRKIVRPFLRCLLIFLGTIAIRETRAASITPIESTRSPGGIYIALVSSKGGDVYDFIDPKTDRSIGQALGGDWAERDNISLIAEWNKAGDKVALLVGFGTKGSAMFLYRRLQTGRFEEVDFASPDPLALYKLRNGHDFPPAAPGAGFAGADLNELGPWVDDDRVMMLSGVSKDVLEKRTDSLALFVTYLVKITRARATVSEIRLIGPFTDSELNNYLKDWEGRKIRRQ